MDEHSVTTAADIDSFTETGSLDGLTILRFAHAYDAGGGTERYLDDLDRALLERSKACIIRLHLTDETERRAPIKEAVGRGLLIRIALPVVRRAAGMAAARGQSLRSRLKQRARSMILYNPLVWHTVGAKWTQSHLLAKEPGQAIGAGEAAREIFTKWNIDLVVMHFFGGADAGEVLAESRKLGIPSVLVHHYSNDRLLHLAVRKHVMEANAVAGVNGLDVPRYLRGRVTNVSDGIDTEFFRREHARPVANLPPVPTILMPARLIREKGQLDLVRAVKLLQRQGLKCGIAFAGRVDASDFVEELRREIDDANMTNSVQFLGDLPVEKLRDWYAASAVVAFPTYHHEGLGRVTVEAQAMGVPAVAYATGGVAEGIVPGVTGYLVRTGDVEALAQRLGEILSSPELREKMGRQGRMAVEKHFSLAAFAERHERFYLRVIGQRREAADRLANVTTSQSGVSAVGL